MDIEKEIRILKILTKILGEPLDEFKKKIPKEFGIMDGETVMMVIANNKESKKILSRWLGNDPSHDIPKICYEAKKGDIVKSNYNIQNMKQIIELMNCSDDFSVAIKIKRDSPATFSNSEFTVILAPRILDE